MTPNIGYCLWTLPNMDWDSLVANVTKILDRISEVSENNQ